jgi:beta-lactamase regulating signal transducer with metallopeptidase domain
MQIRIGMRNLPPMTWGGRILLPPQAQTWSAQRLALVLRHECRHIARRDSLIRTVGAIIRALFWFSPAVWFALQQLILEQERDCDAHVVAMGGDVSDYAHTLIDVAARGHFDSAAPAARRSDLERRIVALIEGGRRRPLKRLEASGLAVTGSLAAIVIALTTPAVATPALQITAPHLAQITSRSSPGATFSHLRSRRAPAPAPTAPRGLSLGAFAHPGLGALSRPRLSALPPTPRRLEPPLH